MKAKLVITKYQDKDMGFFYEDNTLLEVHSFDENIIGNIYIARVDNIVNNIDAAFLSIGTGDNCYYSLRDNTNHIFLNENHKDKVQKGDLLLVQVSRSGVKTKKDEATSDVTLTGKYVVINRSKVVGVSKSIVDKEKRDLLKTKIEETILSKDTKGEFGAIVRTAAASADLSEVLKETITLLCKLIEIIRKSKYLTPYSLVGKNTHTYIDLINDKALKRNYEDFSVITDIPAIYDEIQNNCGDFISTTLFEDKMTSLINIFSIERNLEKALARKVYLKSGGYLYVEPTEALTVIDVNTGKSIQGSNTEQHVLNTNIEAAIKITQIIRLRNLSGIIIIDFINMQEKESINKLISILKQYISTDNVKFTFVDITPLGLVELTRKKTTRPLHEIIKKKIDTI